MLTSFYKSIFLPVCLLFMLAPPMVQAQKVALVLSGGGSKGVTHIGVIRALEEQGIPINFIAGTSMGAIIGGLYAAGYSPDEMQYMINSREFKSWVSGKIDSKYLYFFRKQQPDASWFNFKFRYDSVFQTVLPTNIISPLQMDFALMEIFSSASAVALDNFDSLFVPFRCVASDIAENKPLILRNGNLGSAIRASMTFPFYFKPIRINGKLLFDGGMYNNFPADVALQDFNPDIIIGSKAASNYSPPNENDVLSQIQTMLMLKTGYELYCDNGVLISPRLKSVNVNDFSYTEAFVDSGYAAAMRAMPAIRSFVTDTVSFDELQARRQAFNSHKPALIIDSIFVNGINPKQSLYVDKLMRTHYNRFTKHRSESDQMSLSEIKPEYFKLIGEDRIDNPYPQLKFNPVSGLFKFHLDARRENKLFAELGGLIASNTTNEIFAQFQYNYWGKFAMSTLLNGYFGRFYNSAVIKTRIDLPADMPYYLEVGFTGNQWNYFKTSTYFFDDKTPSYILEHDNYFSVEGGMPVKSKGKITFGAEAGRRRMDYYQTNTFTRSDTSDKTYFDFYSPYAALEINTLNRKQYANSGVRLYAGLHFISGREKNVPGSTAFDSTEFIGYHNWFQFKLSYENFFFSSGKLTFGLLGEVVLSNQNFFHNYTASMLLSPAFTPVPEMKTFILPRFHAPNYAGIGLRGLLTVIKNVDFRLEGYIMQPFREIETTPSLAAKYGQELVSRHFIATSALVYQSPLGPIALSLSYYDHKETPFSLLFSLGYIIFNKRSMD
jgi:NTE family protein